MKYPRYHCLIQCIAELSVFHPKTVNSLTRLFFQHTLSPAADDNDTIMMHMLNTWKAAIANRQRNASLSAAVQQQPPSLVGIPPPSSYTPSHHHPSSVGLVPANYSAAAPSGVPFNGASFAPLSPLPVHIPAVPVPQNVCVTHVSIISYH